MNAEIFQINLLDWFAIWAAILVVLLLLMWFSREPADDRDEENTLDHGFGRGLERAEEGPRTRQARSCRPQAF